MKKPTKPARVRKPAPFSIERREVARCYRGFDKAFFVDCFNTGSPKTLRRLAAWCERVAVWLEQERKR